MSPLPHARTRATSGAAPQDVRCLAEMVLEYQRSGENLQAIVERLAWRIYRYPLQHRGHDEDDCGECYLLFYPRLLRCLARFRDQGKPFEWYLNAVLRWHWKAYCQRQRVERAGWLLAVQHVHERPQPFLFSHIHV